MNLSQYKWWGALRYRVIAKEKTVCLHPVEKYERWRMLIHRMITKQ